MPNVPIDLQLWPKQGLALLSDATEIAYGGAAGGGKSHLARVSAIHYCANIPGLQAYLFRREHNELVKNHIEGPTGFPALLHPWVRAGLVRVVKDEIRFWNGSKIFMCHCQYEKDVFHWLGPEMHYLIIEQAEQFTEFMIRMLRSRNRIPDALQIPEQYKALFPRVLYSFNPGGPGHAFFKKQFYDVRKALVAKDALRSKDDPWPTWLASTNEGGKIRQFVQAKLEDNPSINPVEYRQTLSGLPPRMRDALLEGDMEQVQGAFFPTLNRDMHLIKPQRWPDWWTRQVSMDYGACGEGDPYSIQYWAISDGTVSVKTATGQIIRPPREALICYRVLRGHGLPKTTVGAIAARMKAAETKEHIVQRVAGGDIKQDRGLGTTVFEEFSKHGFHFLPADQRRLHGWAQLQERIVGDNDVPMVYWTEECEDSFDSIRNMQHDVLGDPNDVAQGDDHCGESARYQMMARPWSQAKPVPELTHSERAERLAEKFQSPSIDELWDISDRQRRAR